MPLLDRQKREALIGTIRVGTSVPAARGRRPVKLDRFRFTSRSEAAITLIAELFGGEPRAWVDGAPTPGQFEVITNRNEIGVAVPPGGMLTQDYEAWDKGIRKRLCDSATERLHEPRPCPCAEEGRRLCKAKSRLRVILPDVPGGGTWGLSTVSENAADELAGVAGVLDQFALQGRILPAVLRLELRVTLTDKERRDYPVVVLQLTQSPRELAALAAGAGTGMVMLPPAPPQMAAIEARRAATPPAGVPVPAIEASTLTGEAPRGPGTGAPAVEPPPTPATGWERPRDAAHLAAMVASSPSSLAWVAEVKDMAERAGWMDSWVETRFSDAEARLYEVFNWRTDEITEEQVMAGGGAQ